jgi:L-iditol 2-dehydrogenase
MSDAQVQPKTMKALFYPEHHRLEINSQPVPVCSDDEVLLKVAACGICGSELETFRLKSTRRVPPLIMGHEFCGEIVVTGKAVRDWKPGRLAVSNSIISCGHCTSCIAGRTNLCESREVFGMHRNGAFAGYVNVPAHCLIPIPSGVSLREACLSEPLANGVHLVKLTRHLAMKNILVIGAGPIGLMAQQAFQTLRDVNIIVSDIRNERLAVAEKLGASAVINPAQLDLHNALVEKTGGEGIDLVVDAVGSPDTNYKGLRAVRQGGALIVIGLYENSRSLYSYDIVLAEKQVIGSYAATQEDMEDALELIVNQKVDVHSWVHYYSLTDGVAAFNDMKEAKGNHIKSVLVMDEKGG